MISESEIGRRRINFKGKIYLSFNDLNTFYDIITHLTWKKLKSYL